MRQRIRYALPFGVLILATMGCKGSSSDSVSGGLDERGARVEKLRLELSGSGYGFAIWESHQNGTTHVVSNNFVPDAGFGGVTFLNRGQQGVRDPDVAMGPLSEDGVAVWAENNQRNRWTLYACRYDGRENRWGDPEVVIAYGDREPIFQPRVAVDEAGNVLVAWTSKWYEGETPRFGIYASRWFVGDDIGRWDTPIRLDRPQDGHDSVQPTLAINDGGYAVLTYLDVDEDGVSLEPYACLYVLPFDGGDPVWSEPTRIGTGHASTVTESVRAIIDLDRQVFVAWEEAYQGEGSMVYVARNVPGEGWGDAEYLAYVDGGGASPDLGTDFSGNWVVIWSDEQGILTRTQQGGPWSETTLLSPREQRALEPKLSMGLEGESLIVWYELVDGSRNMCSILYTPESGWEAPSLIATIPGEIRDPSLATDFSGASLLVWVEDDGETVDVRSDQHRVGLGWSDDE